MTNVFDEIKSVLNEKIDEFKNDLLSIITNDEKKQRLKEAYNDMSFLKIMFFIGLLNPEKLDSNIKEFMENFAIDYSDDNYNLIKKHYQRFIEIKNIILKK